MIMDAIELLSPAVIPIKRHDSDEVIDLDLYEVNHVICENQDKEGGYIDALREYMAGVLDVEASSLMRNQVVDFGNIVIDCVKVEEEDRKKKREQIASSLRHIRESRQISGDGATPKSQAGSETSPSQEPT